MRGYLLAALIEETYPSGRKVKNTLDVNGDLSQVQSKKNANYGYWAYAGSFAHNRAGAVTKMQLGNGRWDDAQLALFFQKKAGQLEPKNILYDFSYNFSISNRVKAEEFAKQLSADGSTLDWLKSKGFPGQYVLRIVDSVNKGKIWETETSQLSQS